MSVPVFACDCTNTLMARRRTVTIPPPLGKLDFPKSNFIKVSYIRAIFRD